VRYCSYFFAAAFCFAHLLRCASAIFFLAEGERVLLFVVGAADEDAGGRPKVERTKMVFAEMTPLLLVLWREQHPQCQEQIMLGFDMREPSAEVIRLFKEKNGGKETS
jgi:hypothetical protein